MSESSSSGTAQSTPKDVAEWMLSTIQEQGELSQNNAFYEIGKRFGSGFTTITNSGSPSISRSVLSKFKEIGGNTIIWECGDKKWRKREFYDAPGRKQY